MFLRFVKSFAVSVCYGALIVSLTGIPGVAMAAGACDTSNYERFVIGPDNTTTYAVTTSEMSWDGASTLAKSSGGQLANIKNAASNRVIFTNFSSAFAPIFKDVSPTDDPALILPPNSGKAWIGLYDPLNTATWCMEGSSTPCTTMPQRFVLSGGGYPSYSNWASGQPDGFCTKKELAGSLDNVCDGERWAAISKDGTWSDEGDHWRSPGAQIKAVVEWSGNTLDCVTLPPQPPQVPPVVPLPGADTGAQWCNKNGQLNLSQCLLTTTPAQLCPTDKVACNAVMESPTCPALTTLNTTTHTCQAAAIATSCPSTGVYGANSDLCYKDAYKTCPDGYTFSDQSKNCQASPVCVTGWNYNNVTKRCEQPTTGITQYTKQTLGTRVVKYQARGAMNPSTAVTSPNDPAIKNVWDKVWLTFDSSPDGTKVFVTGLNATGGAGFNPSDDPLVAYPNWNWDPSKAVVPDTTGGMSSFVVTATRCGGYCIGGGEMGGDYCVEGYTPNSTGGFTCAVNQEVAAVFSIDISEFMSCPVGTTQGAPPSPSECTDIITAWGINTGIQDCSAAAAYKCSKQVQACPVGSTQNSGVCSLNSNPMCPTGGTWDGNICTAAYSPVCSDPDFNQPVPGQPDSCQSPAIHTCPDGTTWSGLPVTKCEAIPICSQGTFVTSTNSCYNNQYTCPTDPKLACYQLKDDTTVSVPGVPMTYCSPYACQSDTSGWIVSDDTASGTNDVKNDGGVDASGNCMGSIYLFNGTDQRCRLFDRRGMISSYAKLIAQIAMAVMTAGAGLVATLAESMAETLGSTLAQTLASTIVNSAMTMAVNASIDAATGQKQITAMGAVMSVAMSGMSAYMSAPNSMDSVGATSVTTANGMKTMLTTTASYSGLDTVTNNSSMSAIVEDMTNGMTPMTGLPAGQMGWMGANPVTNPDGSISNTMTMATQNLGGSWAISTMNVSSTEATPFQSMLSQANNLATQYEPAIQQGMLGNYSETRCCSPDKMSGGCEKDEFAMFPLVAGKQCHKVGDYCATKFLGLCIVEKSTYCCFNSILARVFQEQGRPDLKTFSANGDGGWGVPLAPNCRGFTPDEFQQLDFSTMDMSEYTDSLATTMQTTLSPKLNSYLNSVGTNAEQNIQKSPGFQSLGATSQ